MFLHQSNRLETLLDQLRAHLAAPLTDPLAPEIIVVQNQGMAQWVAQRLAFATGIAANLDLPLPARFVWNLFHRLTGEAPQEDLFRAPVLRWRVAALLPQLLDRPAVHELAVYLRDDAEGKKRHQLCGRIGDVFDQYLIYRPDLLARWEQGEEAHWQAVLWRELTHSAVPHRARLAERFRALLTDAAPHVADLPERLHLFGLNALAPVYLEIVQALSRVIDVHLYHLSPCRHYWGDLVSARQLAGMRRRGQPAGGTDDYYEQGHPLLASLGVTGQDFFRQLLDCEAQESDLYQENGHAHLLATLHNDILDLHDRSLEGAERYPLCASDRSLQFHCCFSPLREVQVLHDRLLDLFQRHPDLTPGDILVSAPDIRRYAAAVAGVFGEAGQERRIPWALADQSLAQEQPLVRCLLDLLDLFGSRFTAPDVLALCETPALLRRFGLDPAILPRLHLWVRDTGIRWGLDASHRQELEIQSGDVHSWRFGLDRLLLGSLMGECEQPYAGRLPYGRLAAGDWNELGGFASLIDALARWRQHLRHSRTAEEWCGDLLTMLADVFAPEDDDQGLASLHEAINGFRSACRLAGHNEPLSFAVVKAHLEDLLSRPGDGQPFLGGRVTFCNMVPMRSVPFRVICLLGMNDQDFPRAQHPVAFDLMAHAPRLGDRNRRLDDRYLFLEALLSARDVFYLSWVGRSQRDDSVTPPSVVVSELRDYLDQSCTVADGGASVHLTTGHPMQPFSRRCFAGNEAIAGYNPCWLPAAQETEPPPFLRSPLEEPGDQWRTVELGQFVRFWRHPVRFFLERIVGLRLRGTEPDIEESEPFTLDALDQYHLRRETVEEILAGRSPEQVRQTLEASGRLPQGNFGRFQFAGIADAADQFAGALRPLLAAPRPPVEIDRSIGLFRLTGWLTGLHRDGRITWRTGALKGADLVELWLQHLCLNLLAPPDLPRHSLHLARDSGQTDTPVRRVTFGPVADPETQLHQWLDLYWQGLTRPLPFFPQTSLAWVKAEPGSEEEQARKTWVGGNYLADGESNDPAYRLVFAATELPDSEEFVRLARLLSPLLDHLEDVCAAA